MGDKTRSASGIQKQWRFIHLELLKKADQKYPNATSDCLKLTGADRARRLSHRDQYFNLEIRNNVGKLTDDEVLEMLNRDKKEDKKAQKNKSQKKLPFTGKRGRPKGSSNGDSNEMKKLKLELARAKEEIEKMAVQLQARGFSLPIHYAYRYIRSYADRGFEFEDHPMDSLKDSFGKTVAPLVGSLAALIQYDLWEDFGERIDFINFDEVLGFIRKHIHKDFLECISLYIQFNSKPIDVLASQLAKRDSTIIFIPTMKGCGGPGHFNHYKEEKYMHIKGKGVNSSKTFQVLTIDVTANNVFYAIFEFLWKMIRETEPTRKGTEAFGHEDISIVSFNKNMDKEQRLAIQETLASHITNTSPGSSSPDAHLSDDMFEW